MTSVRGPGPARRHPDDPPTLGIVPPRAADDTIEIADGTVDLSTDTVGVARPRADDTIEIARKAIDAAEGTVDMAGATAEIVSGAAERPRGTTEPARPRRGTEPARPRGLRWRSVIGSLGRAPETLAASSLGVLIVIAGYAGARSGAPWATGAYWIGQVVVFCPVALRLLARRLAGQTEAFTLVIGLAVNQYALKWGYSPDRLRFPDELQHWSATRRLLDTGALFGPNPSLPVARHFPGLAEMGAAVAALTGVSVTTAAFIVAGCVHVALVGLLFATVRRAGGGPVLAGLTCLVYATGLHYLFFDSMYVYQTGALPFLMLALWAAAGWRQVPAGRLTYPLLGLVALAAVTVTHHITAMVTVGALALLAVCDLVIGRPRRPRLLILVAAGAVMVVAWFRFVATDVVSYLGPPVRSVWGAIRHLVTGASTGAPAVVASGPPWETAVQAAGLIALLAVLIVAVADTARSRSRRAWQWAALIGAVGFFATTGARFLGEHGPELAGRAATFSYLPVAVVTAAVLRRWRSGVLRSRHLAPARAGARAAAALALATLLMVGARVGGWPPRYERLPGGFLAAGFERSADDQAFAAANWTRGRLGPGHRFAADNGGDALLGSYGAQVPVRQVAQLYDDPQWGLRDQELQQALVIEFIWADLRLSTQLPASGGYFADDPKAGARDTPLPRSGLTKFAEVVGVNRVYDGGSIAIYDVRNS